jgi:BolA protein
MLAAFADGKASSSQGGAEDMGAVRDRIVAILTEAFAPSFLEVVDESGQHKGHSGWREGGETHFRLRITAAAFSGMSRLEMHRAVNQALLAELAGGVHALAIEARSD